MEKLDKIMLFEGVLAILLCGFTCILHLTIRGTLAFEPTKVGWLCSIPALLALPIFLHFFWIFLKLFSKEEKSKDDNTT